MVIAVFALTMATASAAIEIVEAKAAFTADYKNFVEENQKNLVVDSQQFTVKNTGAENKTVKVTVTGLPAGYTIESKDLAIEAGKTSDPITLKVNYTHKENSGEKKVGVLTIGEGATTLDTVDFYQNTVPMLEFKKLGVDYTSLKDDDEESESFTDNAVAEYTLDKEVKAGSEMILTLKLENLFDEDYDSDYGEITDIKLSIDADDSDVFADDFEEDYGFEDMDAGKKQELEVKIPISKEAENSDYILELTIEGEDGKGAVHKFVKELKFEVDRADDDVQITKAAVPAKVTACDKSFSLDVELENFGTDEQKKAALSIYSPELAIQQNIMNVALEDYSEDDNTWAKKLTFGFTKEVKPGTYLLQLKAFVNNDDETDDAEVDLVVEKCPATAAASPAAVTQNKSDAEVTTSYLDTGKKAEPEKTAGTEEGSGIIETIESSYTKEDILVGIVIVSAILIIILFVVLVVTLMKRKEE